MAVGLKHQDLSRASLSLKAWEVLEILGTKTGSVFQLQSNSMPKIFQQTAPGQVLLKLKIKNDKMMMIYLLAQFI